MDAHDLFRQLTRGAKFTVKKNKIKDVQNELKEEKAEVKSPPMPEEHNLEDAEETTFEYLKANGSEEPTAAKKKRKQKKTELSAEELAKRQEQERVSNVRKEKHITVYGNNIPNPIETFDELRTRYKLSERLVQNLQATYVTPTPVQMQAIPIMLEARPLMACAPTGSGKTIAFLTPMIHGLRVPKKEGFRSLILAPTRELAQQIYRECARLCEKTALKIHIMEAKAKPITKKYDILISTPNRIRHMLIQEPPMIDLSHIEWFIIDEADRLLEEEEENNFKNQLDDILAACTNSQKKIALFSATYTVPVAKWAMKNLKKLVRIVVGTLNAATVDVEQQLLFVGSESGKLLAVRNMIKEGLTPPLLVFVQSKDRAKQLFQELLYDGINVDIIHADRTQQQRDNCVRAFREGHIWVLICTELMSRGIDFKGVNLVINYDFPPTTISYIHRVGRAGRAGRRGKAVTFFTLEDSKFLHDIAQIIQNSGGQVPDFMLKMKKPSKSKRKQLKKKAPNREEISTQVVSEEQKQRKLQRLEKTLKSKTLTENGLQKKTANKLKKVHKMQKQIKNKVKT